MKLFLIFNSIYLSTGCIVLVYDEASNLLIYVQKDVLDICAWSRELKILLSLIGTSPSLLSVEALEKMMEDPTVQKMVYP